MTAGPAGAGPALYRGPVLTRIFDERHSYVRLTLLVASGLGYLLLLRDPGEHRNAINGATDAAALLLCLVCVRWPLVGSLAQTGVLVVAMVCGAAEPVVPTVAASWAAMELALRASGWRLTTVVTALAGAYVVDEWRVLPAEAIGVAYTIALVVGVPVLVGANIRSARQLAHQAERRASAEADRRLSDTRAARADERTAIARELHDVVAHHVASIVLRVGVARHVLTGTDPRVAKVLDDVHNTGGMALADLRRLVTVLRDPGALPNEPAIVSIEPGSLPAALSAAVEQARLSGITVETSIDPALSTVDAMRGLAILRLTQEGLTNVARHAGPSAHAALDVSLDRSALRWRLTDDGGTDRTAMVDGMADDGLAVAATMGPGTGHGIIGMRERVEVLGGELTAGPTQGAPGWTLCTVLPEQTERGGADPNRGGHRDARIGAA